MSLKTECKEIKNMIDGVGFLDVSQVEKVSEIETQDYENIYLARYKHLYLILQSFGNDQIVLISILNENVNKLLTI